MNITIRPLPGHPFLVEAREATRSPQELLGGSLKTTSTAAENVLLTHPPVLLIQEGGGEQLLNRDAVVAQLGYPKSGQKKRGPVVPASLRVWIIDPKTMKHGSPLLWQFLFGPIQSMYYYKKRKNGEKCWLAAMREIENSPHLKSTLEDALFDGEALALAHYLVLLSASQIGKSSIEHVIDKIRDTPHKNNPRKKRKIPTHGFSDVSSKNLKENREKDDAGLPPNPFPKEFTSRAETEFDMVAALSKISQAAERGAEQFTLGIETEGC
ncbi:hypothetical protein [Modicisalibacter luteus]|uniref:Uncharacterized protein n=1 Tax=Modicisalibacter luteus TaxID=453962 RepID=A0ABV7M431_9GAMM|nr:hypothetical protein [Halomonas lutea]GHA88576.1 hypothetical protein GCM10007159_07500 [Halomonas lutea]